MKELLEQIKICSVCKPHLEFGVNPVIQASSKSKIIIISQAPGRIVHNTNIPWNDKSGDTLRNWLGIDKELFYNDEIFALIPMSFCFPGKGKSGDLPPRKECAPLWHEKLLTHLNDPQLILLVGQYAQNYYLKDTAKPTLTETVRAFENYLPRFFPLPHPSPRNNIWQSKNSWFQEEVLPILKTTVRNLI
jgi:uracil-DNA glycosylase